jgi:hypothetical protein
MLIQLRTSRCVASQELFSIRCYFDPVYHWPSFLNVSFVVSGREIALHTYQLWGIVELYILKGKKRRFNCMLIVINYYHLYLNFMRFHSLKCVACPWGL